MWDLTITEVSHLMLQLEATLVRRKFESTPKESDVSLVSMTI